MVNVFGIDLATGFARLPFDNVGMQYGLAALNAGTITFDQFIDLNAHVGGHDIDGNIVANRTLGDAKALRTAYETGRMNEFGAGLASVPIIDVRSYLDFVQPSGNVDVHNSYHSRVNAEKVVRNKPAALVDACYDASLGKITDAAQCEALYPKYGDPRLVAGAPATDDVLKCALKTVETFESTQ